MSFKYHFDKRRGPAGQDESSYTNGRVSLRRCTEQIQDLKVMNFYRNLKLVYNVFMSVFR